MFDTTSKIAFCHQWQNARDYIGTQKLCLNATKLQDKSSETYTNHTWMSQLVPIVEMMFGVTRHGLSFDVGCQTQFYKNKREISIPFKTKSQLCAPFNPSLTQRYVVLHHFVNKAFRSTHFRMQESAVTDPVRREIQQQVCLLQLGWYLPQFLLECQHIQDQHDSETRDI